MTIVSKICLGLGIFVVVMMIMMSISSPTEDEPRVIKHISTEQMAYQYDFPEDDG